MMIGRPDGPAVRISDCLSDGPSSNLGQVAFCLIYPSSTLLSNIVKKEKIENDLIIMSFV